MISDQTQESYSLLDLGFNKFLVKTSSLLQGNDFVTPEMQNVFTSGVPAQILTSGESIENIIVKDGYIKSSNYEAGVSGWLLTPTAADMNITFSVDSLDIPDDTTASSFHVDTQGNAWWGCNVADFNSDPNNAVASILKTGVGRFTNITITGGSVAVSALSGIIAQTNLNVADRGWTQTSVFSVTDADTVAWGAGTFTSADGTAYNINAGNTGNMAAKTYIYLDVAVSTTAYQTTTTSTTAVGAGKVLIAIAQNATAEATFQVMQGQGGQNIDAANIVAGSITANEIAASTITAGKLNISTLSSITADIGTITAGSITGITITGGTIQTSSGTSNRIVLSGSGNALTLYDTSNNSIFTMQYSSSTPLNFQAYGASQKLLLQNINTLQYTGDLVEIDVTKSNSTGRCLYMTNAGTGAVANFTSLGSGKTLILTTNTGYGLEVVVNSSAKSLVIDGTASKIIGSYSQGAIEIQAGSSSASTSCGMFINGEGNYGGNVTPAIEIKMVNSGGSSQAFAFMGSEKGITAGGNGGFVSNSKGTFTLSGFIEVYIGSLGVRYIPYGTIA